MEQNTMNRETHEGAVKSIVITFDDGTVKNVSPQEAVIIYGETKSNEEEMQFEVESAAILHASLPFLEAAHMVVCNELKKRKLEMIPEGINDIIEQIARMAARRTGNSNIH